MIGSLAVNRKARDRIFPQMRNLCRLCLRKAQGDMATAESKALFTVAHKTSKVIEPKPSIINLKP